jgi:hypothetical protein
MEGLDPCHRKDQPHRFGPASIRRATVGNGRVRGFPRATARLAIEGRAATAHRRSWELTYGPIPTGMHVLHRCDNPPCVRPDHLWLGTNTENVYDSMAKGRRDHLTGSRLPPSTCTKCGVQFRTPTATRTRRFCSRACQRRLSDADVAAIRVRVADGSSQASTARAFGVSHMTVWAIVHGRQRA